MAKALPDRQSADAAVAARGASQSSARSCHDDDVARVSLSESPTSHSKKGPDITRRDVHTAPSVNAQRRFPKSTAKEPNLAHQAALRRTNETNRNPEPEPQSTAHSRPVLVRAPSRSDMRQRPKPVIKTDSPNLPAVESFSFQAILASLGSDAETSIDAIAEICGRSKMSLADEHGSHRPPQTQFQAGNVSPHDATFATRLETVPEANGSRPHTRSMSRGLTLASQSAQAKNAPASPSTVATSNVTSHAQPTALDHQEIPGGSASGNLPAYLLPQILSWIRNSNPALGTNASDTPDAASALHRILHEASSIQS